MIFAPRVFGAGRQEMIAPKNGNGEEHRSGAFLKSKKVYAVGKQHKDVRVPAREIELSPTVSHTGRVEVNEPVRVYDTSGPWSDPVFHGDVNRGLPALRRDWILGRGDVEETSVILQAHRRPERPQDSCWAAAEAAPRETREDCHAIAVCAAGNRHARDGIHCESRGTRDRSLSAAKWPGAGPSFPRTSIIPRASR